MKNVPKKLTMRIPMDPKLSLVVYLLTLGYIFSKKRAAKIPANNPDAIAAPILMQVPATGPYIIAPVRVPMIDPRIPIFPSELNRIEKVYVKITLALRAI